MLPDGFVSKNLRGALITAVNMSSWIFLLAFNINLKHAKFFNTDITVIITTKVANIFKNKLTTELSRVFDVLKLVPLLNLVEFSKSVSYC